MADNAQTADEVIRRMKRMRNLLAAAWIVVTFGASFVSAAFVIGSSVGWSLGVLVCVAYAGQMEAERRG